MKRGLHKLTFYLQVFFHCLFIFIQLVPKELVCVRESLTPGTFSYTQHPFLVRIEVSVLVFLLDLDWSVWLERIHHSPGDHTHQGGYCYLVLSFSSAIKSASTSYILISLSSSLNADTGHDISLYWKQRVKETMATVLHSTLMDLIRKNSSLA